MFVCECLDEFSEFRRIFANVCVCVFRQISRIEKNFRKKNYNFREKDEISRMFVIVCEDELRRIFANTKSISRKRR